MWTLHNLGTAYQTRPSTFLGLTSDSWIAYQVDLATLTLGRYVERRTTKTEKRKPPTAAAVLARLEKKPPGEGAGGEFASLRGKVTRRMRVPESGVW